MMTLCMLSGLSLPTKNHNSDFMFVCNCIIPNQGNGLSDFVH